MYQFDDRDVVMDALTALENSVNILSRASYLKLVYEEGGFGTVAEAILKLDTLKLNIAQHWEREKRP
jgi:hypothetical protein